MLKELDDFRKVTDYFKRYGFKNKNEMESYLKNKGFGVKFLSFYTDSEESNYAFRVACHNNQVHLMEILNLGDATFGTSKKQMVYIDAIGKMLGIG